MTAIFKKDKGSLPSFVAPIALFVQVVHSLQKLWEGWICQESQVCDTDAPEALGELFTIVAECLKVFESFKVHEPPQLGVVIDEDAECNHFRGDELFA